ncbi:MAG TPA: sulfur carrier protein ThiS [Clostridiales bacterium]|nr:sulfur carrier protein ThiS [Clostridiales bacterium]
MAKINGEIEQYANGMTISEYVSYKGFNKSYIAVEINGKIMSKSDFNNYTITAQDKIEIVNFVGGG